MDIQFLGTGAGQPSKARNVSSLALKLLDEINEVWLFDCGEATQNQILETTIRPRKVSKIFITHLHGDHIFGLPGFLSSRAFQANEEQTDLDIYGPVGIKSFVMTSLRVSGSRLPYRIHFHEFDEHSLGKILETDKFTVYAEALDHTIFCVGYRIMQKDLEGTLDADKLKAAGVPFGPLFGQVKMAKMSPWKMELRSLLRIIFQPLGLVRLSRSSEIPERLMPASALGSMRMSWSMSPPMARAMRRLLRNTVTRPICRQQKWRVKQGPSAFF